MSTKIYEVLISAGQLKALFELADDSLFPLNPTPRDFEKVSFVFSAMHEIADNLVCKIEELDEELSGATSPSLEAI